MDEKKVRKLQQIFPRCSLSTSHISHWKFNFSRFTRSSHPKKKQHKKILDSKHTAEKIQFVNETNTRSAYLRDDRGCFLL